MADRVSQAWIGRPLDRIDGPAKVTGKATYTAEVIEPGTLFAVVLGSTVARGRLRAADTRAAQAVPGVVAIWTALDAPRLERRTMARYAQPALEVLSPPYWVLQDAEVHFHGQEIGLMVAQSSEAARHAADLVRFDFDVQTPKLAFDPSDTARLHKPDKLMIELEPDYRRGEVGPGLANAAVVVDATYDIPVEHHNPIETGATVASFADGRLTVHTTTQDLAGARLCLANSLSLPPDRIRVISRFLGGGFGGKNGSWPQMVLASLAARELGQPVRLELTRQQMFSQHGHRAAHRQRVRLGATRDGQITAITHDVVVQTDQRRRFVEHAGEATTIIYACPNVALTHRGVPSDIPVPTIMRAPGAAPGMFALESAVDELAFQLGLDPIALRIQNDAARDPEHNLPWSSRALVESLRVGAERFGWARRMPEPRSMREDRLLVGYGVASATYPANRLPSSARVRLSRDGQVKVETAATDIGTGTYTILAQIAADALTVPIQTVQVVIGDSDLPETPGSGGSWGAMSYGTAVKEACGALLRQIGVNAAAGQKALIRAMNARGLTEAVGEAKTKPKDKTSSSHAFGAHFVEVRVDPDTCEIRVPRMLGVFGVGQPINPKTARSQLMGGMVWGLGMALHEAAVLDQRYGHFVNADLAEYHVPVNADIRDIDVMFLDEKDKAVSSLGGKGLGEIGIVGVAAAVASAVHHATGIRVRQLPINVASLAGKV